jgi:hypothetical protein
MKTHQLIIEPVSDVCVDNRAILIDGITAKNSQEKMFIRSSHNNNKKEEEQQ